MAAIHLKITDNGNGILVQGTDNVFFPDNATLTFPYNSIILIVDESDMVTFRSAANNDVLFSGLIGYIEVGEDTVTKANIIEKFDAVANQATGGGEEVDYSHLFYGVSYDSQTKKINFYDKNDDLAAQLDATAFIKDGMVDSVAISNGNLVITFNTDAGKQPISIPLTDIFDPANYYTKTQTDNTFATQTVVNQEIAARIQGDADINTALGTKADKSDTYTKTQVDDALALKQDASTAFSGDYDDLTNKPDLSVYAESADLATVATSGDYDDLSNKPTIPVVPTNVSAFTNDAGYLTQHQSLANYYTKSEVDAELADKQDTLTAGANITIDANNVISSTGGTQVQSDWNQSDSTAVDYIKNKPTIPDTSDFVTKAEYNPKEVAIANALTDLNENKADKTELPDTSTFATKTELNAKQDTLTAGTGISIQNDVISATGGGGGDYQFYSETVNSETGQQIAQIENGHYDGEGVTKTSTVQTYLDGENSPYVDIYAEEIKSDSEEDYQKNADVYVNTVDGVQLSYQHYDNIEETSNESHLYVDGNGLELYASETANSETVETYVMVTKDWVTINSNKVLTDNDAYTKTEIDAMIGNINTILASI